MNRVKQIVRVMPGHRVEFIAPELAEGELVEVVVIRRREYTNDQSESIASFLDGLPDGPRAFSTWGEYERFLCQERDSWDR